MGASALVFAGMCSYLLGGLIEISRVLLLPLWSFVGDTLEVDELEKVQALDALITDHGRVTKYRLDPSPVPTNGVHFIGLSALVGSERFRGGVVAWRATGTAGNLTFNTYTLYILCLGTWPTRRVLGQVEAAISGDPSQVLVRHVEKPDAFRIVTSTNYVEPPKVAFDWQRAACLEIIGSYRLHMRSSALVLGKPGTGKSKLAMILANMMREMLGVRPVVVYGASLTTPGAHVRTYAGQPKLGRPVLLVLNEIDIAILHAEKEKEDGERATSLAKDPARLHDALDMLNEIKHLVVLATTNKSLNFFEGKLAAYVRVGRLDHKFLSSEQPT